MFLKFTAAEVHRSLVRRLALDELEIAVRELENAGCEGFETAQISVAGSDQSTVVKAEDTTGGTPGQFEIARVVQLTDELNDRGQANAAERTLQFNHVFDLAEALMRNAKIWSRRAQVNETALSASVWALAFG